MFWKSGNVVCLRSGGEAMEVIGCDSVGSVICRPLGGSGDLDLYVPPSLLVAAEPQGDAGASDPSAHLAMEKA